MRKEKARLANLEEKIEAILADVGETNEVGNLLHAHNTFL